MLRYYSYYSVGGYKDFFLGSNTQGDEATYFFSMMEIWEEEALTDKSVKETLKELKSLPAIKQLTDKESYGLPSAASRLVSHGGYKLMYRHLDGAKYAIALKNIPDKCKDENGRSIPFLFLITCDSTSEIKQMDALAAYIASNMKTAEKEVAGFIGIDFEKNGLRFELAKCNAWVNKILSTSTTATLVTTRGAVEVHGRSGQVALIALPTGIPLSTASEEQGLSGMRITMLKTSEIVPLDDPQKLKQILSSLKQKRDDASNKYSLIKQTLGLASNAPKITGNIDDVRILTESINKELKQNEQIKLGCKIGICVVAGICAAFLIAALCPSK